MLRARCSYAILKRPGTSSRSKNPVSPIIPVHPQKQGGGGQELPASEGGPYTNFELLLAANSNYSRRYAREPRKSNHSRTYAKTGGGGYPKEVKEANEVEEAKEMDYERAFLTPVFTTTLINIVGAPTFPSWREAEMSRVQQGSRKTEGSLDYATRRARIRHGRENRVAPLGMT